MNKTIILAFVYFLFQVSSPSIAKSNCQVVFRSPTSRSTEPEFNFEIGLANGLVHANGIRNPFEKEWDQLPKQTSDLEQLNAAQFTLLVHAGSTPSKVEKLLQNNNLLEQSFNISASLIDQDHRTTYGKYGVILSAPTQNILATSPADLGSPMAKIVPPSDLQKMKEEALFYTFLMNANPVLSPSHILKNTKTYNEIMVAGTTVIGGPIKIIGLFLKTKNGNIVEEPKTVEKLKVLAENMGLPILRIEAMPNREF